MIIELSSSDLLSSLERVQQNTYETIFNLPRQIGAGGERIIYLRSGLCLILREAELCQPIRIENPHGERFPLVSKFHLSGNSRVLTPGIPEVNEDYEEIAGCNYLYYLPDLVEFEEWRSQESIQVVMVIMDLDCLREFGLEDDGLPEPLQQFAKGELFKRFHQSLGLTTMAMRQVLQQILQCPYHGIMQQMYLESKALELLALQLTQSVVHPSLREGSTLKAKEIERLYHAREILVQDLENPPALTELAHQVGISDRKLKRGFRQLFGNTVFGYLHDYRLEQARQLLEQDSMTVTEVCYAIGFANRGYFAAAFRRKFGHNPGEFQIDCRKNRCFSR